MPHYYLDVRYPDLVVEDATGHDFDSLSAAVGVAQALLCRVHVRESSISPEWPRVEIFDDHGMVATFPRFPAPAARE